MNIELVIQIIFNYFVNKAIIIFVGSFTSPVALGVLRETRRQRTRTKESCSEYFDEWSSPVGKLVEIVEFLLLSYPEINPIY